MLRGEFINPISLSNCVLSEHSYRHNVFCKYTCEVYKLLHTKEFEYLWNKKKRKKRCFVLIGCKLAVHIIEKGFLNRKCNRIPKYIAKE